MDSRPQGFAGFVPLHLSQRLGCARVHGTFSLACYSFSKSSFPFPGAGIFYFHQTTGVGLLAAQTLPLHLCLYFSSNPTRPPIAVPPCRCAASPLRGDHRCDFSFTRQLCRSFQAQRFAAASSLQLEGVVTGLEPLSRGGGAAAGLPLRADGRD